MTGTKDLRRTILEEAPRLQPDDRFHFACHPGVACFNHCCGDINIVLTPYDVLRLKTRLGIRSEEFHRRYTLIPFSEETRQPTPMIKMLDDVEGKPCPFVGDEGCTVYEDRPWACRMYPLGLASPMDDSGQVERFFFLLEEDFCKGHLEQHENTVAGWIDEQGVAEYDEAGELFKPVSMHPFWDRGDISPSKMDMFFMASYDVDRFRRFIFDSTFLDKFVVDDEVVEQIRVDDTALMRFGFDWLRFALFEEPSMKLDTAFKPVQQREKEFFDRDKDR